MEDYTSALRSLARNALRISLSEGKKVGRFGGIPDVPPDFSWPLFATRIYGEEETVSRPLSFFAQFDCSAFQDLDPENTLPHEGILSFFYEMESQVWGSEAGDMGSAQVFWFPEAAALVPGTFPQELDEDKRFPSLPLYAEKTVNYPSFEDFALSLQDSDSFGDRLNAYEAATANLGICEEHPSHKLLGWPNLLQGSPLLDCELTSRGIHTAAPAAKEEEDPFENTLWGGISLGGDNVSLEGPALKESFLEKFPQLFPKKPPREEVSPETSALNGLSPEESPDPEFCLDRWRLLFQLDSFQAGDFTLSFGDWGSIYFFIPKEDLAARRFDRVWLILQCS